MTTTLTDPRRESLALARALMAWRTRLEARGAFECMGEPDDEPRSYTRCAARHSDVLRPHYHGTGPTDFVQWIPSCYNDAAVSVARGES